MAKKMYAAAAVAVLAALFAIFAASGTAEAYKFPGFSTKDLDGNVVTNEIFAKNEITMINFWATWCPPCIHELPDLAYMGDVLAETDGEGGLIGILLDSDAIQRAKDLLSTAEASFPQLLPSSEMNSLLRTITAIPTSIFVDSKGNIVGPTVIGARSAQQYMAEMRKALEEARE